MLSLVLAACTRSGSDASAGDDYTDVLAQPPASVGTCIAPPRLPGNPAVHVATGRRLAISRVQTGTRREITVFADSSGAPVRYVEFSVGGLAGRGTNQGAVIASLFAGGVVRGVRQRIGDAPLSFPRNPVTRADSDAVRAAAQRGFSALTAAEQQRVRELTTWMTRRCVPVRY